jgi:hypothetical protein
MPLEAPAITITCSFSFFSRIDTYVAPGLRGIAECSETHAQRVPEAPHRAAGSAPGIWHATCQQTRTTPER